jgi:hypothetical protein
MQKGSPTNYGKTTSKCNTRTKNGKEPVRKHEEYPVYEIPNSSADLAKGGELSRHIFVNIKSKVTVTTASVFHDSSLLLIT